MYKVYLGRNGTSLRTMFLQEGYEEVDSLRDADVLALAGGGDIDPALYNAIPNPLTGIPHSYRDASEAQDIAYASSKNIPIVGICRGAQMLCALAGGGLYQHVSSHNTTHNATIIETGQQVLVTSTHHQMMDVLGSEYKLLVVCSNRSDAYYKESSYDEVEAPSVDVEVVYFPKLKALASQPHPEYMQSNAEYYVYFFEQLTRLIRGEL